MSIQSVESGVSFELGRLFSAYPSLGSWLSKLTETESTAVKDSWERKLSKCDLADITAVVDDYLDGRAELPQRYDYDRLGDIIRSEASRRRHARSEVLRVKGLTQQGDKTHKARARRWRAAMTLAMDWGVAKHLGLATDEENTRAIDQCDQWMRHGEGEPPVLPANIQDDVRKFHARRRV